MSNPKDYAVGWICAITTEYVAAQLLLDEKHELPDWVAPNDNNDYTLGRIGRHNVVIAVLPDGEYGVSSATGVAKDMLHSFPNVRIGLMVGIGGGAPSPKHDIRLGDIVVSAPRNGSGGIFQFDFGKMVQDRGFEPTKFLNQPPTVLRTAISGLESYYEIEGGHQLEHSINQALGKRPWLRKKYQRPCASTDRLYQPQVAHLSEEDCSQCGDDSSKLVGRVDREENTQCIHYGLIASSNQLMKDAFVRNRLAAENDVLCFEMEAAGLVNFFPCLAIRGICDYSDTHKNKAWQGYAALSAAAYAKDLLKRIPPNKVEAESKLFDALNSVSQNIFDARREIKDLATDQKQIQIIEWLSPPDPSTNHNKALEQRQKGTCQWLLENEQFLKWKSKQSPFIWVHGMPGCGKTILSSSVVEHLKSAVPNQSLLYFYFSFNDSKKQTLEKLLRSLVAQVYSTRSSARSLVDSLFVSCKNGNEQPRCESLQEVFMQMIVELDEVWIVLDALDECTTRKGPPTQGILSWIKCILVREQAQVHLLATSRPEQDILSQLSQYGDCIIPLQSHLLEADICAYIHHQVRYDDSLERWRSQPDTQDEIENTVAQKANGMFRWVACQMDILEHCLDYASLQTALSRLPKTLDDTYHRILHMIPDDYMQTAIRILQLLTYSKEPLPLKAVVDAIATRTESAPYFVPKYRMPNPSEVTRFCSSLVVIVGNGVQLAHFSVKEYLISGRLDEEIARNFQEKQAQTDIAELCIAHLLCTDHNWHMSKPCHIRGFAMEQWNSFPFTRYSELYWSDHTRAGDQNSVRLCALLEQLFNPSSIAYKISWKFSKLNFGHAEGIPPPLYFATVLGLYRLVKTLLEKGIDVNAEGGDYGCAVIGASGEGYEDIVEVLLDYGADVNMKNQWGENALEVACSADHQGIVKRLVARGADIHTQFFSGPPLQLASRLGREQI